MELVFVQDKARQYKEESAALSAEVRSPSAPHEGGDAETVATRDSPAGSPRQPLSPRLLSVSPALWFRPPASHGFPAGSLFVSALNSAPPAPSIFSPFPLQVEAIKLRLEKVQGDASDILMHKQRELDVKVSEEAEGVLFPLPLPLPGFPLTLSPSPFPRAGPLPMLARLD